MYKKITLLQCSVFEPNRFHLFDNDKYFNAVIFASNELLSMVISNSNVSHYRGCRFQYECRILADLNVDWHIFQIIEISWTHSDSYIVIYLVISLSRILWKLWSNHKLQEQLGQKAFIKFEKISPLNMFNMKLKMISKYYILYTIIVFFRLFTTLTLKVSII